MALTYTPAPVIGSPCPSFSLPGVDGKTYSLEDFSEAKAILFMFICNHCPYVQAIEDRLIQLAKVSKEHSVAVVGICANDPTDYPEDSPAALKQRWEEKSYGFPYLIDESQETAKAFGAVCTPDFFLYDENKKLTYRGRLDDSWKDQNKVSNEELKQAIMAVVAGQSPVTEQVPSMGCSIKWKTSEG